MAATPQKFNSKSPTIRRILREAQELSTTPSPDYTATPLESDLFEWHFTLRGPPNSCYAEGIYHGRIVLPPTYPLRPPSFRFATPSGRFEANREICLSISGHHEETWQPAWGVRTALVALRSFMETDPQGQLGGLETSEAVRRRLAGESRRWRCGTCGRTNAEIVAECEERATREGEAVKEVEVPAELKMGWRDEMEKKAGESPRPAAEGGGAPQTGQDAESAELAEGFVQTVPMPVPNARGPAAGVDTASLPARPGQSVPQPTRTVPLPNPHNPVAVRAQTQAQAQAQAQLRRADDGVPLWIDRLIVVLGVSLAAMVIKVLYAMVLETYL